MICSICYLELTLLIDTEDFKMQLDRAYQRSRKKSTQMYPVNFGHVDESLTSRGIGIVFISDCKRKKIKFIVFTPNLVIDDNDNFDELWEPITSNTSKIINNLEKLIGKYFHSDYSLNDFNLTRVDYAVDVDVGSREGVADYIKVLHNIRRVKCFSPMKYGENEGETKDQCFGLVGNSSGVEFRVHAIKHKKRALRIEVRLTSKGIIRDYSGEYGTAEQIKVLADRSKDVVMDTFRYIIPPGDFYKKSKVEKLIYENISDRNMRFKMTRLLALIKEQKSLLLGQKAIDYRKIKDIMSAFAEIDVSPVTISKRHDVKKLDSLYSFL